MCYNSGILVMIPMKLIFIRHGQSNYNLRDLCNSQPNPKVRLTALGQRQVRAAAEKLKKEKIDAVYISELYRAKQTARAINAYHHAPVFIDGRLNDRDLGYEGRPASLYYQWIADRKDRWKVTPPGGESYEHMKKRLASFLRDLAKKDYRTVLITTHLPILKAARGYFKNLSNEEMDKLSERQVPNCRIMRFDLPSAASKKPAERRAKRS